MASWDLLLGSTPFSDTEKQTAGDPPGLLLSEDGCKGAAVNPLASRANISKATARKTPRRHQLQRYRIPFHNLLTDLCMKEDKLR